MKIAEFLSPRSVIADLGSPSKHGVLCELCASLSVAQPGLKPDQLVDVLEQREKLGSTGIGEGVAIPHGKVREAGSLLASFGVSHEGVNFDAIDGKPSYLFFALIAPENSAGIHLKALARISRLFKNPKFREQLMQARTAEEIYSLISEEDSRL
jgi:PTS system nitrogen regulatory IIA component